jgi:hypothetical protein
MKGKNSSIGWANIGFSRRIPFDEFVSKFASWLVRYSEFSIMRTEEIGVVIAV